MTFVRLYERHLLLGLDGGRVADEAHALDRVVGRCARCDQRTRGHGAAPAGRVVRVLVVPDVVDDIQAQVMARDIAKQVEEELTYPGQIRISVVRESRATEFAR